VVARAGGQVRWVEDDHIEAAPHRLEQVGHEESDLQALARGGRPGVGDRLRADVGRRDVRPGTREVERDGSRSRADLEDALPRPNAGGAGEQPCVRGGLVDVPPERAWTHGSPARRHIRRSGDDEIKLWSP